MVKQKQTVSEEHATILCTWKQRGFVEPSFDFEELTEHYMGQLCNMENLSDDIYVQGHKGKKVRIYKEIMVTMNEERMVTAKTLLLQSGQNNFAKEVRQHLLQKYDSKTVMPTAKVDLLSSYQSILFCLDNVPLTYGKEEFKDAILEMLITEPNKCAIKLKAHFQKTTQSYKQLILELIQGKEMKAGIFYVAAARLLLDELILLIRLTEHTSGTSTPFYTFEEEYCILEDKNLAIEDFKIHLVYNGWNHFTPFFPCHVVNMIRKGEPIL